LRPPPALRQHEHLLQTSIFLEILRMKKGGESSQPFRNLRGND